MASPHGGQPPHTPPPEPHDAGTDANRLFIIRARCAGYDRSTCPLDEWAYTEFYQPDCLWLIAELLTARADAAEAEDRYAALLSSHPFAADWSDPAMDVYDDSGMTGAGDAPVPTAVNIVLRKRFGMRETIVVKLTREDDKCWYGVAHGGIDEWQWSKSAWEMAAASTATRDAAE